MQPNVVWAPQAGPQMAALHCPVPEICYGGARGGGKTDLAIGMCALRSLQYGAHHKAVFFRRELPQLEEVIARSHQIFGPLKAEYVESKKTWTFPNGATVKFRHLDRDQDAELYQGHQYQFLVFEEAANFPSPGPIMKLKATLRSAHGVPCQMLLTCNPSGPGMTWVKKRYVDPAPLGYKILKEMDKRTGRSLDRVFIPSRLTDNKILMTNDPDYELRLAQVGSDALVRAWLDGDWNVVDGAFFDNFSIKRHVIRGCELPDYWVRIRAGDWGSAKPYAFMWAAVASEPWFTPDGTLIPKGALVVYREHYGVKVNPATNDFEPNVGTRQYAEAVARELADIEAKMPPVQYGVLDPAAFAQDGGPSIAERIYVGSGGKIMFRRADNKRVPGRGAMGGWDQVRARLDGEDVVGHGVKAPMLFLMDTCVHGIRTIPMQQHDPDHPEDLNTDGEDHWVDALRYLCTSRPYTRPVPSGKKPIEGYEKLNLQDLWDHRDQELSQGAAELERV